MNPNKILFGLLALIGTLQLAAFSGLWPPSVVAAPVDATPRVSLSDTPASTAPLLSERIVCSGNASVLRIAAGVMSGQTDAKLYVMEYRAGVLSSEWVLNSDTELLDGELKAFQWPINKTLTSSGAGTLSYNFRASASTRIKLDVQEVP